jgi:prepilin-type N-terminal cleavage/methylation domain-containing protein
MRSKRAFSLLELLVVIAIIGVVAGLGFLNGRRIAEQRSGTGALATGGSLGRTPAATPPAAFPQSRDTCGWQPGAR